MLTFLRPELLHQVRKIMMQLGRNAAVRLRYLLTQERGNPAIRFAQPEDDTVDVATPDKPGDGILSEDESVSAAEYGYPDYYPPVLVRLLVNAANKVAMKRRLSNSLQKIEGGTEEARQTVNQILTLADEIDEAYNIKRRFDKEAILPKHLLAPVDRLSNDVNIVEKELRLVRSRISRNKAKLNNPREVAEAGPMVRKWRAKLEEDEQLYQELKQRYVQLKAYQK